MQNFSKGENVGNYVLEKKLGEGGWGEVWLARHSAIKNKPPVAIKFLLYLREDMKKRFKQEADILYNLRSNPHIITVEDFGEHNGISYFMMQYAPGGDLSGKIGRGMSPEVVEHYLKQIANALDYAHAKGIIHRDLKPGNILFDKAGKLLLSDFGIAHTEGSNYTKTDSRLGTPPYMAPEQFTNAKAVKNTADIYSLGVVVFQLLTGSLPFLNLDHDELLKQKKVPKLESYRSGLPKGLQAVIEKAMAKEPDKRYQTAE
ncbi:MAG: serine/threonine-protein kinase, partial [Chloroflexota bacterium]